MSATELLLRWPAVQAIGWALLHFVWQGTLVALAAAAVLAALRRAAADVRYVVATIALAVMFTLPVVTGVQVWRELAGGRQNLTPDRVDLTPRRQERQGEIPVLTPRRQERQGEIPVLTPRRQERQGEIPVLTPRRQERQEGTTVLTPGRQERQAETTVLTPRRQERQGETAVPLGALAPWRETLAPWRETVLPALLVVWILGVSALSLRLLAGWLWIRRMRTHHVAAAAERWQRAASGLCRRMHITRAVTLLESALVEVPTVVGWLKPVVLLPATALSGLTPVQIEAILAHELAHIRRHDYLVNLLQTAIETLLFYHPAVWWLSRRIRAERENCCDDLAVRLCGDRIAYANALADLESLRGNALVLAANGGSLLHRVRRVLGAPASHAGRGPAWLAGGAAVVLVCGIVAAAERLTPPSAGSAPAQQAAATLLDPSAAVARANAALTAAAPIDQRLAQADAALAATAGTLAKTREALEASAAAISASSEHISLQQESSSGSWIVSNNGDKLAVSYNGSFDFTDDDTDVRAISDGGHLKISDAALIGRHTVELFGRGGTIERHYYVNGIERAYEPEGRQWLRENLPRFVRNTGLGADRRVARILRSGGAPAVLAEISRIESSYVKGIYFQQLMKQAALTPDQYRELMAQASREMTSDYELAQLLIAASDRLPSDDASRAAYFGAAAKVSSDYELHRVYSAMLKKGPVPSATLAGILSNTKTIESEYELSQLLQQILALQPLDDRTRPLFFAAASTIGGDYEHARVLGAAIRGGDAANRAAATAQAGRLSSDYERSQLLQEITKQGGIEGPQAAAFFDAVRGMGSYERGRVLGLVVSRPDAGHDTLLAAVRATRGMSDYELSQVLQATAAAHVLTGDLRDAYVDAASGLGDYEQGRALTALVKGERRR